MPQALLLNSLSWIVLSIAVYAAATNLGWALWQQPRPPAVLHALGGVAARWTLLGLYLLGVPMLALLVRPEGLSDARLGLGWPASGLSMLAAIGFGLATLAALLGSRAWYEHVRGRPLSLGLRRPDPKLLGQLALWALLLEAHWAFFRAGALASGQRNVTLAVFLALGLLALESWTNPWQRDALLEPDDALVLQRDAMLAVQSGLVFLATGSSVACLAVHVTVAFAASAVAPHAAPRPARPHSSDVSAIEPTVV